MSEFLARGTFSCRFCGRGALRELISFGRQPRCFDFRVPNETAAERFPLSLAQCGICGLIQLLQPISPRNLIPSLDWLKNKEPEEHLLPVAGDIVEYMGNDLGRILAISDCDEVLANALEKITGQKVLRLAPYEDLGIKQPSPGQALIQAEINCQNTRRLREKLGSFDLIVCCRLLEHSHNPREFIQGIRELLVPGGRLIIEIPDSIKSLEQGDIAMLWEEHTSYFTRESLGIAFLVNGMKVEKAWSYPYPQEDALVVVVRENSSQNVVGPPLESEIQKSKRYIKKINHCRENAKTYLTSLFNLYGGISVFGAGHRATMFINLLAIDSLIDIVVDDDSRKQNLQIPGTKIVIQPSSVLAKEEIGVCIMAIAIESEEKVIQTLRNRLNRSLEFFSLSPDSNYALPIFR